MLLQVCSIETETLLPYQIHLLRCRLNYRDLNLNLLLLQRLTWQLVFLVTPGRALPPTVRATYAGISDAGVELVTSL